MGAVLEMKTGLIAALVGLTALAGCGNDKESLSGFESFKTMAKSAVASAGSKETVAPKVSRAMVDQIAAPVRAVTLEKRNQQALMVEIARNNGVETWSSVDKVTISVRNGVLVATRGLGDDLMAASAQHPVLRNSADGGTRRTYSLLNGADQMVRVSADCVAKSEGVQAIEIVEKTYNLNKVVELCTLGREQFTNIYWLDSSGSIRKSRQWVSPNVGSIIIEDL